MLDIVASYHCIKFQRKLMNQPWENGKKPSFEPNFFFKNLALSVTTTIHKIFETNSSFHYFFPELFASIDKIFILAGRLGTRLSFYEV